MWRFFRLARGCCTLGIGVPVGIMMLVSLIAQRQAAKEEILRSQTPVEMSAEEFIRSRPAKGWYRLTGAVTDVREAALLSRPETEEDNSRVSLIMFPTRARREADPKAKSSLALFTSNDDIRALLSDLVKIAGKSNSALQDDGSARKTLRVKDLLSAPPSGSRKEVRLWLKNNQNRLLQQRTVAGKVVSIKELHEAHQKLFHAGAQQLAPDAVALIEGAHPPADLVDDWIILVMAISIVFGALIGAVYVYQGVRNVR